MECAACFRGNHLRCEGVVGCVDCSCACRLFDGVLT